MNNVDLSNRIDLHIHPGPDIKPRLLNDLEAAQQARDAGMAAIMLKCHVTCTADRAQMAEAVVDGVRVFGGLACNAQVGWLNPAAVEAALALGAKEIWLPTFGGQRGDRLIVLQDNGQLQPEVLSIMEMVRDADIILATGHITFQESMAVVAAARDLGLKKVLITHVNGSTVNLNVEQQKALVGPGIYFERCYYPHFGPDAIPMSRTADEMRTVGVGSTVLCSDGGQVDRPAPVEQLRAFLAGLNDLGITWAELDRVTKQNPAYLLGLQ